MLWAFIELSTKLLVNFSDIWLFLIFEIALKVTLKISLFLFQQSALSAFKVFLFTK